MRFSILLAALLGVHLLQDAVAVNLRGQYEGVDMTPIDTSFSNTGSQSLLEKMLEQKQQLTSESGELLDEMNTAMAEGGLSDVDMIKLQQMINQWTTATGITSNMIKAYKENLNSIIQNT